MSPEKLDDIYRNKRHVHINYKEYDHCNRYGDVYDVITSDIILY